MPLEHLENDQPHLDVEVQRCVAVGKHLHHIGRSQGVGRIGNGATDQIVEPQGQVHQRNLVARSHPPDHAVQRHGLLELVRLHQTQGVEIEGGRRRGGWRLAAELKIAELTVEAVTAALLEGVALQPQLTHRIEEHALLGIVAGAVGLLEQGVVGVIEQLAQTDPQEGERAVADRRQRRVKGATNLRTGSPSGVADRSKGNHVVILGHCRLLSNP